MNSPFLTAEEEKEAALHHAFAQREDVKELTSQLNDGLVSPVEYANAILALWSDTIPF